MGRKGGLAFSASPGPSRVTGSDPVIPATYSNSSLLSPGLGMSASRVL